MKIIMAGSATGGHLYPALAVAERVRRRVPDSELLFVAARWESSSDILNESGYEVRTIDARGFDRQNLLKNISVIKDLMVSFSQIERIFSEFQPELFFGTGGYVCAPVIRAAARHKIPAFLHEQNVIPGMANRLAERYADEIFVAFPESEAYFKRKARITATGNPVRKSFLTAGAIDYRGRLGIAKTDTAVLIFGGSQGSDRLNEVVCEMLPLLRDEGLRIFYIAGRRLFESAHSSLNAAGALADGRFQILEYTEEIHAYYAAADLIVARSGAMTVSEIAVLGKASILIPSPNVTRNHQYFNAKTLADRGAAIIIDESGLSAEGLKNEIMRLKANKQQLNRMSAAASGMGRPDAADVIADRIIGSVSTREGMGP